MLAKVRARATYANVISTLALVAVVGAGGFAAASIPGPDKRVHSCFKKRTGALRVVHARKKDGKLTVAKCRRGERRLAWNQRGRRGKPGPAGPSGAVGARGPSDGFARYRDQFDVTGALSDVLTLSLPPGRFMIFAKVQGAAADKVGDASAGATLRCRTSTPGAADESKLTAFQKPGADSGQIAVEGTLDTMIVHSSDKPATARLECSATPPRSTDPNVGTWASASWAKLHAIQVADLTNTQG